MRHSLAVMVLLVCCGPLAAQPAVVRIGTVTDGPWTRNAEVRALFEREMRELLRADFVVEFPAASQLEADWTREGVRRAVDRLLADDAVDLLITLGLVASVDVARRGPLPKPVVAPFVPDATLLGLGRAAGSSGVANLVYVSHPSQVVRDLEAFREVVGFDHLAVLANPFYLEALPDLRARLEAAAASLGIRATILTGSGADDAALAGIPADADAVFLAWLTNLGAGETERLIAALTARGLPTLSFFVEDVMRGAFMSLNGPSYFPRIARRVALNAQRILLGEAAATLPVDLARDEELRINMATARAIGLFPSFAVMTEAILVNEVRRDIAREVTLASAMSDAIASNVDLAAQRRATDAGARDVTLARSALLPQAELEAQGLLVDRDRAASSFGALPQRSLVGGVSGSQVIFSEGAWANLSIQGSLQRGREEELQLLELDVALEAAVAYLEVLRAKTLERIARENLGITRSNLDLARVRVALGSASSGETLRWDAEVAAGRQSVISANARRNVAEIELNRVLQRPLEEPFATAEASIEDAPLMTGTPNVGDYLGNPASFRLFRAFMVAEALAAAPELRRLDAVIAAQERAVASARNAYWAPTVALFGDLGYRLAAGGAGAVAGAGLPTGAATNDDLSWNVGIGFSLPLLAGGARPAAAGRAGAELARLRLVRDAATQRVEQRTRSALHFAGASFANIRLARDAATAARESFNLAADAYARGLARLVDLLDAQNAAVIADLGAANAVFDFLSDFIRVERSVGRYQVFGSADDRDQFFARLDAFFEQAGVSPPPARG